MTPDEVGRSYDELAEHWASHKFPRENGIAQHERAVAFVKTRRRALDIGCGSSGRIVDFMLAHGFAVEGVDVSQRMIEWAKRAHPDVVFHHADIREWHPSGSYDFISAWDSVWHVPLADQEPTLMKILSALAPGGVLIFTTGGLDEPSEKVDSAMGPPIYYSLLGIPRTLAVLNEAGCVLRHLEYDQYPELHVYLIAQRS
jgi:2-polyprenyl-3-methyl-5-hydroxy-6-metoxy-1,4-benzoquinol methylase